MATTMRAAVAHEYRKPLTIEQVPIPEPGPGQVVVKVARCGVCHSDVHAVDADLPYKPKLPLIPGHEVAGHVAKLGAGVTHLKEGDVVGVPWLNSTCGHCEYCLTGWENLCKGQLSTGFLVDGGYAEYVLASANFAVPLPAKLPLEIAAPILCAGLTVYKGIKESEARPGQWVAVCGVGGLGHLAVEYAKAMGLHVAAIDVSADKLDLAKRLGADLTVNASEEEDAARIVRKATGGCHGVLVTAAAMPAYDMGMGMVRTGGTLVMIAIPNGELRVPIVPAVSRGLTIRGSSVGNRQDLREALDFAAAGLVKPEVAVKPLEAANETLDALRKGTITGRVVLNLET